MLKFVAIYLPLFASMISHALSPCADLDCSFEMIAASELRDTEKTESHRENHSCHQHQDDEGDSPQIPHEKHSDLKAKYVARRAAPSITNCESWRALFFDPAISLLDFDFGDRILKSLSARNGLWTSSISLLKMQQVYLL